MFCEYDNDRIGQRLGRLEAVDARVLLQSAVYNVCHRHHAAATIACSVDSPDEEKKETAANLFTSRIIFVFHFYQWLLHHVMMTLEACNLLHDSDFNLRDALHECLVIRLASDPSALIGDILAASVCAGCYDMFRINNSYIF